jgi:hypothetical protein
MLLEADVDGCQLAQRVHHVVHLEPAAVLAAASLAAPVKSTRGGIVERRAERIEIGARGDQPLVGRHVEARAPVFVAVQVEGELAARGMDFEHGIGARIGKVAARSEPGANVVAVVGGQLHEGGRARRDRNTRQRRDGGGVVGEVGITQKRGAHGAADGHQHVRREPRGYGENQRAAAG